MVYDTQVWGLDLHPAFQTPWVNTYFASTCIFTTLQWRYDWYEYLQWQ